jgi:predicted DNA-binding transcriptional regulator AlpA
LQTDNDRQAGQTTAIQTDDNRPITSKEASRITGSEQTQKKFLRFRDLKTRGIVNNWTTLRRWIKEGRFPPGRLIGPNTRVWTEEEIERWIASCPTTAKKEAGGHADR